MYVSGQIDAVFLSRGLRTLVWQTVHWRMHNDLSFNMSGNYLTIKYLLHSYLILSLSSKALPPSHTFKYHIIKDKFWETFIYSSEYHISRDIQTQEASQPQGYARTPRVPS